jgi:hypothetical protein
VPFPRLPPELLTKIVNLAATAPTFDFIQCDWAITSNYPTLKALCLTSPVLNELASPLLYRHVVLPTANARARFAWTVKWRKWKDPTMADRLIGWIQEVVLGRRFGTRVEADGDFVEEVIGELSGGAVAKLALVGLKLGPAAFTNLNSKPCPSVSCSFENTIVLRL